MWWRTKSVLAFLLAAISLVSCRSSAPPRPVAKLEFSRQLLPENGERYSSTLAFVENNKIALWICSGSTLTGSCKLSLLEWSDGRFRLIAQTDTPILNRLGSGVYAVACERIIIKAITARACCIPRISQRANELPPAHYKTLHEEATRLSLIISTIGEFMD
jgi:hypothetical protein